MKGIKQMVTCAIVSRRDYWKSDFHMIFIGIPECFLTRICLYDVAPVANEGVRCIYLTSVPCSLSLSLVVSSEPEARPSVAMSTMSLVSAQDKPALWLTADTPLSENTTVGPALSVNGYSTSQITALSTTK